MASVLDIGVDLGTSSVVIYGKGKNVVLNEPAVIAFDRDSRNVLAVGEEAHRMIGRTPSNIVAMRPLQNGMIADFELASASLFETGARRTQLMERPIAAAIGAGLHVGEAYGEMIVDIGGGTADIAVISQGRVIASNKDSVSQVGGDYFDDAIIK